MGIISVRTRFRFSWEKITISIDWEGSNSRVRRYATHQSFGGKLSRLHGLPRNTSGMNTRRPAFCASVSTKRRVFTICEQSANFSRPQNFSQSPESRPKTSFLECQDWGVRRIRRCRRWRWRSAGRCRSRTGWSRPPSARSRSERRPARSTATGSCSTL